MAPESLVDAITHVLRELGGEAQLKEIQSRVLKELGEGNSRRSRLDRSVPVTIRQHSEGRGSDRFERVRGGRYRLRNEWLDLSDLSDER